MKKNYFIGFLAALVVLLFGWGIFQTVNGTKTVTAVENMRQRSFYDLIDATEKLSVLSSKIVVTNDHKTQAQLLTKINTEAYVAQENLSQLPLYHNTLLRTEKFLNQMGDFSYSLLTKTVNGEDLSDEEQKNLTSLNKEVENIALSLQELSKEDENPFSWKATTAAKKKIESDSKNNAGAANDSLSKVSTDLEEIPALIYDGPFSDDLENKAPVSLEGEEATWDQLFSSCKGIFGNEYQYKAFGKTGKSAGFAAYTVEISDDNENIVGYFDFSKIGGYPIQYTAQGKEGKEQFTAKQGLASAENFINKTAYQNMKSVYYLVEDNILTANFVYEEEGVAIYPDMVKISVDLSTNEVTGLDAKTYLGNHEEREPQTDISIEEAKSKLKKDVSVTSEQVVVIPLDRGGEALCYEFKTTYNGYEFLQYINAKTGVEEDILRIITTKDGTFTI